MFCDSSKLHKQKLVKPKPLASKMAAVKKVGQKNDEVVLLVEYLFCDMADGRRFVTPIWPTVVTPIWPTVAGLSFQYGRRWQQ